MGSPPIDALLIIVAVIVTTATMQAAGGTDWMVLIAARLIAAGPRSITIIAPVVSLILDTLAGTSNIVFSLLPVIEETAYRTGARAHKPLSMCVVATSIALATSPVSAAMAAMITVVEDAEVGWSVAGILALTYPAALIGTVITAVIVSMIGRGAKGSTPTDAPRTEELLAPLRQRVTARGRATALIYLAGGRDHCGARADPGAATKRHHRGSGVRGQPHPTGDARSRGADRPRRETKNRGHTIDVSSPRRYGGGHRVHGAGVDDQHLPQGAR